MAHSASAADSTDDLHARHRGLIHVLDHGVTSLAIVAMGGFAATMLSGVFFRYVLNASLPWSDELSTILFGWSIFLFVASAYLHDEHVHVDMLIARLSGAAERWAGIVREGLTLGFFAVVAISCFHAWEIVARARTDALQLPATLHFAAIPCSVGLMIAYWIARNARKAWLFPMIAVAVAVVAMVMMPLGKYVQVTGVARAFLVVIALFGPMLIGVPVAISLGLAAAIYLSLDPAPALATAALQIFDNVNVFVLVAIPLLVLSGKLMHGTGIARRLVELAMALVGRLRGGLGTSNVVASFLFGDISGSAVSDTAAIGSLMIPEMKRRGYRPDFCAALQGAAGTLGMTAPLSITVLLYAGATNASVSRLAAAMLLPSLLLVVSFIALVIWHASRHGYPKEKVPRDMFLSRLWFALPGVLALALVLGGILGGIFTPAEVGAILLAYILFLGVAVYRSISPRELRTTCVQAGHISGMTIFMVCTSGLLGFVMSRDMVSMHMAQFLAPIASGKFELLVVLSGMFLVLGMFLEPPAMIFGFLPTFLPLLSQANVDLIHWGVLLAVNAGIGCILPPVALNLFVATRLANVTYAAAARAAVPFIVIMLVDLLILAALPEIALLLPHLIFGHPLG